MRVSHETIYQSLFVQGRGELRRELARCLRSGRSRRKKRGSVEGRRRPPRRLPRLLLLALVASFVVVAVNSIVSPGSGISGPRRDRKPARTSSANSCGCSHAAK